LTCKSQAFYCALLLIRDLRIFPV